MVSKDSKQQVKHDAFAAALDFSRECGCNHDLIPVAPIPQLKKTTPAIMYAAIDCPCHLRSRF